MLNSPSLPNNTTNLVNQQNSRKLPMMDILMSETCCAHKKRNKIASDIKLVFYSSTSINHARSNKHKMPDIVHLLINLKYLEDTNLRLLESEEQCLKIP